MLWGARGDIGSSHLQVLHLSVHIGNSKVGMSGDTHVIP